MTTKRLILFSGGVESTYMLSQADYNDIILLVDIDSFENNSFSTYHPIKAKKILVALGYDYVVFSPKISTPLKNWQHQMSSFILAANLMCLNDDSITEIWTGRNKDEPVPEYYSKAKAAWDILQPNVQWKKPFGHLTKLEQWLGIPDDIKELVSTCIYHSNCEKCSKCLEFAKMLESSSGA